MRQSNPHTGKGGKARTPPNWMAESRPSVPRAGSAARREDAARLEMITEKRQPSLPLAGALLFLVQDTLRPAVAPNRPRRASENSWQPLCDVAVAENGPGRDRRSRGPGVRRACRLCTDSTHLQGRGGPGHRSPSLMRTGEARRRQRGETGGEVEAGRLPPSLSLPSLQSA